MKKKRQQSKALMAQSRRYVGICWRKAIGSSMARTMRVMAKYWPASDRPYSFTRIMGYHKLFELGQPPSYALLRRGHREVHIFQPKNPQVRQWLADEQTNPNDPVMRAALLSHSGLSEDGIAVAAKPRHYHINEVDAVFIVATDEA